MDNFISHILVVDDDDGIRSLVKKYLNENNYLVTTASSAEDASEKIKIIKFDMIVLDIMMPGKSGLEFIKENKNKLETPVILLTAKGEAIERVEGLEIGADDYLPKPFEPRELILRIQNILDKSKFKNTKIDLLNIDVEGAEMKVLNTLNFEIYDPSLICIEILGYREMQSEQREKEIKNNQIFKFLVNKGYKKVWSGISYCSHLFTK